MNPNEAGDLFIVDNSNPNWSVQSYLDEWCDLAKAMDIATGYFEVGSLLILDGKWQRLEKIRILMGDEVTPRTRNILLKVTDKMKNALETSLDDAKEKNDFLTGVPAILAAIRSGQIEVRVYDKKKFHAKAYITHLRGRVLPPIALVGSSNFTVPGLTQNIELNIQVRQEVNRLQDWFEKHWEESIEVNEEVLKVIERHAREYEPFEVWTRALHELFRDTVAEEGDWEVKKSQVFPKLAGYQQSGYKQMWSIAEKWGGAFLCDGVGLGKTYVGLMLIERLLKERKNVVLLAPKSVLPVWEDAIRREMPNTSRVFGGIRLYAHTDLGTEGKNEEWEDIKREADAIVIDEAHHFRNPGPLQTKSGKIPRYRRLQEIADGKQIFLLTATPINNSLRDLQHMVELFSGKKDDYFKSLGIQNLPLHFKKMELELAQLVAPQAAKSVSQDGEEVETNEIEARQVLNGDTLCEELLVQRSRAFVRDLERAESNTNAPIFPVRNPPQVANYSIKKTYGRLLERLEKAFDKQKPLFALGIYYPLAYARAPIKGIDPREENRQHQVVGLIRTNFLKRFESSTFAFENSCQRLFDKLLAFVEENVETEVEKRTLSGFKARHADLIGFQIQPSLFDANPDTNDDDSADEVASDIPVFGRKDYKVDEILVDCMNDLEELAGFLDELKRFQPKHDDKLRALIQLLKSKDCKGQKVLIFTQFTETARYLKENLVLAGFDKLEQLDGGRHVKDRATIIRRFSPYYNGSSREQLAGNQQEEIEILISTDVLSEGLNLQDASRLINYDLHWNPVRLMQRIGRVDRRLNLQTEAILKQLNPTRTNKDGFVEVHYWNFLPPNELDTVLKLYTKLTKKTLLISRTLGIEGKKLFTPEDDYDALRDFNREVDGDTSKTVREELEVEYRSLLAQDPSLAAKLANQPRRVHSGKSVPEGITARGIFYCYTLPGPLLREGVAQKDEDGKVIWNEESGQKRWVYWDLGTEKMTENEAEIATLIRSQPTTPRRITVTQETIDTGRKSIEASFTKSYFRAAQAPLGVKAILNCWMEVS